jgi:hypothetical protein
MLSLAEVISQAGSAAQKRSHGHYATFWRT